MATSTATRFRNRTSPESIVLLDSIGGQDNFDRVLFDSLALSDSVVSTHVRKIPGDRLTLLSDSISRYRARGRVTTDSLSLVDAHVKLQNLRRVLSEFTSVQDDGFITDRDIIRHRQTSDAISLLDSVVVNVDADAKFRVLFDSLSVVDQLQKTVSGVKVRVLQDSLTVTDVVRMRRRRNRINAANFDLSDSAEMIRTRNRVNLHLLSVTDDVIVGRSAIVNSVTLSDNLVVYDFANTSVTLSTTGVSTEIEFDVRRW